MCRWHYSIQIPVRNSVVLLIQFIFFSENSEYEVSIMSETFPEKDERSLEEPKQPWKSNTNVLIGICQEFDVPPDLSDVFKV